MSSGSKKQNNHSTADQYDAPHHGDSENEIPEKDKLFLSREMPSPVLDKKDRKRNTVTGLKNRRNSQNNEDQPKKQTSMRKTSDKLPINNNNSDDPPFDETDKKKSAFSNVGKLGSFASKSMGAFKSLTPSIKMPNIISHPIDTLSGNKRDDERRSTYYDKDDDNRQSSRKTSTTPSKSKEKSDTFSSNENPNEKLSTIGPSSAADTHKETSKEKDPNHNPKEHNHNQNSLNNTNNPNHSNNTNNNNGNNNGNNSNNNNGSNNYSNQINNTTNSSLSNKDPSLHSSNSPVQNPANQSEKKNFQKEILNSTSGMRIFLAEDKDIHCGWMKLRNTMKVWNSRWFVLRPGKLIYCSHEKDMAKNHCLGIIRLADTKLEPYQSKSEGFSFKISHMLGFSIYSKYGLKHERIKMVTSFPMTWSSCVVRCSSELERKTWMDNIAFQIEVANSPNFKYDDPDTLNEKDFEEESLKPPAPLDDKKNDEEIQINKRAFLSGVYQKIVQDESAQKTHEVIMNEIDQFKKQLDLRISTAEENIWKKKSSSALNLNYWQFAIFCIVFISLGKYLAHLMSAWN